MHRQIDDVAGIVEIVLQPHTGSADMKEHQLSGLPQRLQQHQVQRLEPLQEELLRVARKLAPLQRDIKAVDPSV